MKIKEHRGRIFSARSVVVSAGVYRGAFDVDSSSPEIDDGVINEATAETFDTRQEAEAAAEAAAHKWIDGEAAKA